MNNTKETIFIASDHAGLELKNYLVKNLIESEYDVRDLGTNDNSSCSYPSFAKNLCLEVLDSGNKGILICGTGIGMSIVANRFVGIRAALCTHEFHAIACREHNDANVLCLGERITAPGLALKMAYLFLETSFSGGRHFDRVQMIDSD